MKKILHISILLLLFSNGIITPKKLTNNSLQENKSIPKLDSNEFSEILKKAIEHNNTAIAKNLIKSSEFNSVDFDQFYAILKLAVEAKRNEIVDELLKATQFINLNIYDFYDLVGIAIEVENVDIVQKLLNSDHPYSLNPDDFLNLLIKTINSANTAIAEIMINNQALLAILNEPDIMWQIPLNKAFLKLQNLIQSSKYRPIEKPTAKDLENNRNYEFYQKILNIKANKSNLNISPTNKIPIQTHPIAGTGAIASADSIDNENSANQDLSEQKATVWWEQNESPLEQAVQKYPKALNPVENAQQLNTIILSLNTLASQNNDKNKISLFPQDANFEIIKPHILFTLEKGFEIYLNNPQVINTINNLIKNNFKKDKPISHQINFLYSLIRNTYLHIPAQVMKEKIDKILTDHVINQTIAEYSRPNQPIESQINPLYSIIRKNNPNVPAQFIKNKIRELMSTKRDHS